MYSNITSRNTSVGGRPSSSRYCGHQIADEPRLLSARGMKSRLSMHRVKLPKRDGLPLLASAIPLPRDATDEHGKSSQLSSGDGCLSTARDEILGQGLIDDIRETHRVGSPGVDVHGSLAAGCLYQ